MNIVIISSSDSGGAGIAALRLHKALLAAGQNSNMLCFEKSCNTPHVIQVVKPLWGRLAEHLPIPLWNNKYRKVAPLVDHDYECISFPESIDYLLNHPVVRDADIINLHWVGNRLSYQNFFKRINKPIVWTLHDMNPFLGCAHFSRDVELFPKWHDLEHKIRKKKERWIHQAQHIEVVNLCSWMKNYATDSISLGRYPQHIIRNSIDTSIFKIYNQKAARELFQIPSDKTVLMFVSQNINNTRKGFDLLLKAIEKIDNAYMMVVGASDKTIQCHCEVRYQGSVSDEKLMALYYSAADVFLLPSREDNLPNTMVEALCCGTPVISMPNGGMTDIIHNGLNGYLSEDVSAESFSCAIETFINNGVQKSREDISNEAHHLFSPAEQAKAYISVFQNALIAYEKNH